MSSAKSMLARLARAYPTIPPGQCNRPDVVIRLPVKRPVPGQAVVGYEPERPPGVYLDGADPAEGFAAFVRRVNVQLAKPNPV